METNGSTNAMDASAALAEVRRSRARVAWCGYPAWYWLATGTGLSAGTVAILLPGWWGLAVAAVVFFGLVKVAHIAGRTRGVCEGWIRSAMTAREVLALYGPAAVVILADAVAQRWDWWSPWSPVVAATLVFGLFTGVGLTLTARTGRR